MAEYDFFEELRRRLAEAEKLGIAPEEKHTPGDLQLPIQAQTVCGQEAN